jgi:transketolase
MKVDPANPKLPDRDRFILSAGHKCMAQYAVLAEKGFFDLSVLDTYGKLGTKLPGHPDMHKLPGVEANTGALGHGLSISVGMALGLRMRQPGARVFTVLGDGELPEGSNWEAAAAAAHHKLDNLTAFADDNGLQISGRTTDVMNMQPIAQHFAAFGWATREIDGNDMAQIISCIDSLPQEKGKPTLVVARTVKGKGLSFAEDKAAYHYWKPKAEELELAVRELDDALAALRTEAGK